MERKHWESILKSHDSDGDGELNLDEFKNMLDEIAQEQCN